MKTVTLTESGIAGDYLVDGPDSEGTLTLRPEPTMDEVLADLGARGLTQEEFDSRYGDLPSDDEG